MNLKDTDTDKLLFRFDSLIRKYVPLAAELAPKVERFGKYRQELQLIVAELNERGVTPNDPEELTQMMEKALEQKPDLEE